MSHSEPWNRNPVSRPLAMPDGVKRIVTLPDWAWDALDQRNPKARDAAVRLCWSRASKYERSEAFDYMLAAHAHSDRRRQQKFEYLLDITEEPKIPGGGKLPANDHFDPKTLPAFPDPCWTESHCWNWYERRMLARFSRMVAQE